MPDIKTEIESGKRPQGSPLTKADVGRELGDSFGRVFASDIGKRVFCRPNCGLQMENNAQRDARMGKHPTCGTCGEKSEFGHHLVCTARVVKT